MITGKDISTMMDLLVAAYGDKSFPTEPKQMAQVANLWSVMFKDDEPEEVLLAVKNCIATLSFPPRIADIKSRIAQSRMEGQLTEMEAWHVIRNAVREASNRTDANKEYTKLPPILQKCVGNPSQLMAWHGVSIDTFEGVISSNVQRSYRELAKNEAMYNALPKDMQSFQSYLNPIPKDVTMLPEPAPQMSYEDRITEMDRQASEYRQRYLSESKVGADRISAFQAPMTENELKMLDAKKKHEEAVRLERMRA